MRMFDIIQKKKQKQPLTEEEIQWFVQGYVAGDIPDYQASALCMAICLNGMEDAEIFSLTKAMLNSGDQLEWANLFSNVTDKHSTGGIGDKTTLVIAPIAACLGCHVAKMSGRGLGYTGGTIDKLEAIPGYQTTLPFDVFVEQVRRVGVSVIGQSGNLVPADKKLYALRDVTATVDSIPLIASSVMSKKLASGADTIVLDVKMGSGALMQQQEDAVRLAQTMIRIGKQFGRKVSAWITDMSQPLGRAVGNALEVTEACEVLKGQGEARLTELCVSLAAEMVCLSQEKPFSLCQELVQDTIASGRAYQKFEEWIDCQGGDLSRICSATVTKPVVALRDGFIESIDALCVGKASSALGAGRTAKTDSIDPCAGIVLKSLCGDYVKKGDVLAVLHTSDERLLLQAEQILHTAFTFSEQPVRIKPLILKKIEGDV